MFSINYGFQICNVEAVKTAEINFNAILEKPDTYIKSLIIDIDTNRIIESDINHWYPFDFIFRSQEARDILTDMVDSDEKDNIFLREYYFLREFCSFKNDLWFIRPYLYLTETVLLRLIKLKIFDELFDRLENGELESVDFLSSKEYVYLIDKELVNNILSSLLKSVNESSIDDNLKHFIKLLKDCGNNKESTLLLYGSI